MEEQMHDSTSGSSDPSLPGPSDQAFGKQTIGWAFDLDETLSDDAAGATGSRRRWKLRAAGRRRGGAGAKGGSAGGDLAYTLPGSTLAEAGAVVSVSGVNFATFPQSAITDGTGFFQVDTLIFHGDSVPG